ncbi:MAG: tyrosine--tRNA ligase [Candidatus Falkowbacteria bacterium]|nr:tyrosine--tRNA ligase [Candidatus Falkowbacteria bacterium]
MSRVIIDKKLVTELLTRGVEKIYPSYANLEKKLLSGERIRLYCGYDPTASSLHIGNAISINKLGQFQALGHEVIFLVGDFTGLIGDPTDKKATRRKMTREEILANAAHYQEQASAYLKFDGDNPAKIMYNSAWNDKLTFRELIELSSNFTVQQMIQRDMFQERLKEEKPIYLHEFLYPLTQAYDSVVLNVDLEIGGNDQMFNMMCGRDLLRALKNKEKSVLTMKLLADGSGKKMGKSEGNVVFLNVAANDMYGQIMSWPDGIIISALELCTNIPMTEVKKIESELKNGKANPRDFKMKLAWEITKINRGQAAAEKAQENFVSTIQKKEIPEEIEVYKVTKKQNTLVDLLVETKLVKSKTEARQKIEEGAIKIKPEKNGRANTGEMMVVKDVKKEINFNGDMTSIIIQKGKFNFVRVIL